jgi:hypothetical protein
MTQKLTACKHVRVPPRRNQEPRELYSNGQHVGFFSRTLQKLLRSHGYGEPSLFIGTPSLLRELPTSGTYEWCCTRSRLRPHPPHLPSTRSRCPKVYVWSWDVGCCTTSSDHTTSRGGWSDGALTVPPFSEPLQPSLFTELMRDHEECLSRENDGV